MDAAQIMDPVLPKPSSLACFAKSLDKLRGWRGVVNDGDGRKHQRAVGQPDQGQINIGSATKTPAECERLVQGSAEQVLDRLEGGLMSPA